MQQYLQIEGFDSFSVMANAYPQRLLHGRPKQEEGVQALSFIVAALQAVSLKTRSNTSRVLTSKRMLDTSGTGTDMLSLLAL